MAAQKATGHKGHKAASKGGSKPAPKKVKKGSKLASLKNLIMGESSKGNAAKGRKGGQGASTPKGKAELKHPVAKHATKHASKHDKHEKGGHHPARSAEKHAKGGDRGHAEKATAKAPAAKAEAKSSKTASVPTKPAGAKASQPRASGRSLRAAADALEAVCREVACEGLATAGGYCRMHYIKNWKKIKRKEVILREGKLNQYIEELVAKYPEKYIEAIRQDLANDKDFAKVIHDLDLDETIDDLDVDSENLDSLVDGIRRDFEDDGEAF